MKDSSLHNIDLTTPLGADEVMFVRQHREVASSSHESGVPKEDKKKSKKDKSEKKDKKSTKDDSSKVSSKEKKIDVASAKSSKSKSKVGDISASLNLLDLDFGAPIVTMPSAAAAQPEAGDEKKDKKKDKKADKKGDKKEKSSNVWLPFHTGRSVDVFYSLGDAGLKRVAYRIVNRGPVGLSISADVTFKSLHPFQSITGNTLRLAHHLASGGEAESHMDIECPDVITGNLNFPASLRVMLESASGVETMNVQVTLKIPVCTSFTPNALDEEAFSASISKSSSRWASSNARVTTAIKPKYAFRSISIFLRAHLVEAESSKAASLAAKSPSGAKIFALAKAAKEAGKTTMTSYATPLYRHLT